MLFFMTCRVLFTAVLYPATRLSNWSMAFQTPPRLRMIVLFKVTLRCEAAGLEGLMSRRIELKAVGHFASG